MKGDHVKGSTAVILAVLCCAAAVGQPSTTIIAHGLTADFGSGEKSAWQRAMGRAIIDSSPGGEGAVLFYTPSDGAWNLHYGSVDPAEPLVLVFNWVFESDGLSLPGANTNYTEAAGDALYAALRDPEGAVAFELLTGRSVHFIGHSRGAVVTSEAVRRLGRDGIIVDQLTALDPHPVNGFFEDGFGEDWDDPFPQVWENVVFADTYYRQDGASSFGANQDTDGYAVPGSFSVDLTPRLGDEDAFDFDSALVGCSLEHSLVHTWYHGTIDLTASSDGDCSIDRDAWYDGADPGCDSATCTGFAYSALRGAARPSSGPRVPLGEVPLLFNGDFQWSYAGWRYHGGDGSSQSQISSDGVDDFVSLGPGDFITHNRFFLPAGVTEAELDYRVTMPDASDMLELILVGNDGVEYPVAGADASEKGSWGVTRVALPGTAPRERTYTLTLRLTDHAGGALGASIDVRRLELLSSSPCPADLDADAIVSAADLAFLVAGWGGSGPADLDGDGIVGAPDLAALVAAWGDCDTSRS
jgi:hypothetical protein